MTHGEFALSVFLVIAAPPTGVILQGCRLRQLYAAFLEQQNKDHKREQVAKLCSWKDLVILVLFVAIVVLLYKIM
jgi:hypothetical protein